MHPYLAFTAVAVTATANNYQFKGCHFQVRKQPSDWSIVNQILASQRKQESMILLYLACNKHYCSCHYDHYIQLLQQVPRDNSCHVNRQNTSLSKVSGHRWENSPMEDSMPSPFALIFCNTAICSTTRHHFNVHVCARHHILHAEMHVTQMQYCHHIDNAADRGKWCSKYHHNIATSTYYATLQNAAI